MRGVSFCPLVSTTRSWAQTIKSSWKPDGASTLEDQYLTADNRLYEVVEVDDEAQIARAKLVAEIELKLTPWQELRRELGLTVIEAADPDTTRGTIALYHTHNAESYVPTDGTDSIYGKGGIHQVGAAFAEALRDRGVTVLYSEQLHLPHDRGAYRRSRETVVELMSKEPDAIFDVHRDAAPQSAYAIQLEDQWMTSIQFVVGRQNQNLGVNRKYAESLKKLADDMYPGLVKGIYYGRGNYNQDLSPLSLLLEVGAHTNSRPASGEGRHPLRRSGGPLLLRSHCRSSSRQPGQSSLAQHCGPDRLCQRRSCCLLRSQRRWFFRRPGAP